MNDFGTRHHESTETRAKAESVIERVYISVEQLCVGPGDVRKRLKDAVMTLIFLREEDFPDELRSEYNWIISESTKFESRAPRIRGDLEETMLRIRNSTGEKIAQKIFSLYSKLQDIRGFPLLSYRHPED